MITGSATADVGLLLVPAEKGGFEAAIAKADAKAGVEEGQTRQHARLLYLLGVEQIIVGINKMDACDWSESRFNEIKDEFVKMLQMIGFKPIKSFNAMVAVQEHPGVLKPGYCPVVFCRTAK